MVRIATFAILLGALVPLGHAAVDLPTRLGQQCVAEISLSPRVQVPKSQWRRQKLQECRLMWHILGVKVDYQPKALFELVARYNSLWKRPEQRPWVLALGPALRAPAGWPEQLRWSHYRPMWSAVHAAAQAFSQDPGQHPCPRANHFGGRCDDADHACDRAPACWLRQWCGQPPNWWSQAYWYRPGPCPETIDAQDVIRQSSNLD